MDVDEFIPSQKEFLMASHARHVRSAANSERAVVKFPREDLLWDGGNIANPHTREAISVPIVCGEYLVGPTILDMMTRKVVRWSQVPAEMRPEGVEPEDYTAIWRIRDPDTLWPAPGQAQSRQQAPREPSAENNRAERGPSHPFFLDLASGGVPAGAAPAGFVRIRKPTTVSIAEGAYRLAIAMQGSVVGANRWISDLGRAAWKRDEDRALDLWAAIYSEPKGLIEDEYVEMLRPTSSISQEVERLVMREAVLWMGVDPDAELSRPRGRPKAVPGDEGNILRLTIGADGVVSGIFKTAYRHVLQGAALANLDLLTLVETLGALRTDGLTKDAELLESYLDLAAPDWREQAAEAVVGTGTADAETPYDVLGVTPDLPLQAVAQAFRNLMLAVQDLPNASAPQRRFTEAYKIIKAQKKEAV